VDGVLEPEGQRDGRDDERRGPYATGSGY
jgi:hypothetical protein